MKQSRFLRPDLLAVVVLVLLWLLFFWRLFTPSAADQSALKQGDFSGQFVAFAAYQYERFSQGEVPLWNPYNNGGLPFIADTQAAVFYPPRLLTIGLSSLSGGWTYHALELEMTFHVLAFTLMMYAFIRRSTGSVFGGLVAALVAGYGGYLSGYPPLQLALLEAGIWLPLALLSIREATRETHMHWRWLCLTGLALGLSWLAGHPQTSFFLTYLLIAYYAYCLWTMPKFAATGTKHAPLWRSRLINFVAGGAVFGGIAFGLAAVQLLPGAEYLLRTTRAGFGYDAKSNGFPLQDVAQFIIPSAVSLYSPLWVGIVGLALALVAVWRKLPQALFWGAVALVALFWSFGGNSFVYPVLYNLLPGLFFFRGQERAAYLVVNSLAILAGLGAAWLLRWNSETELVAGIRLRLALNRAVWVALVLCGIMFILLIDNGAAYGRVSGTFALMLLVIIGLYLLVSVAFARNQRRVLWLLPVLIVFELFTMNMDADAVYDHTPPEQQVSMSPPPLVAQVLADTADAPFRVDGARGVTDNYGSLYRVMDIQGISPLFLEGMHHVIETDLPDAVTWTLLGVRYVFTDWQELPVPSEIVGTGEDRYGVVNLHRLSTPRPFAAVLYRTVTVASDAEAYDLLRDPAFPFDRTVILNRETGINDTGAPVLTLAPVVSFAPEKITIHAPAAVGILTIALPDYPGWYATVDQQPAEILRAYGGLSAVQLTAGDHLVELVYNPLSYRVGASLSLFTWLGVVILGAVSVYRGRRAGN